MATVDTNIFEHYPRIFARNARLTVLKAWRKVGGNGWPPGFTKHGEMIGRTVIVSRSGADVVGRDSSDVGADELSRASKRAAASKVWE